MRITLALLLLTSALVAEDQPLYRAELIFPLHAQHNHAPGIAELEDGELIVSWYRGSGERKADDVAVYGARLKPGETSWSQEFLMVDTPGFPDCNTCLMTDSEGKLFLFWPVILANTWESCLTRCLISNNPTGTGCPNWNKDKTLFLKPDDFSEEATQKLDQLLKSIRENLSERDLQEINLVHDRLSDKLFQRLGWQPRCKPTVLPSGRILLPLYSDTFSMSMMAISDDGGQSWFSGKPMMGFGNIQPSVLRRHNGTLVAYMRENGPLNKIRIAESSDDGMTWGDVGVIDLPNPGSGLDAVSLSTGEWILVYNDSISGRNTLAVSLSTDEGQSWSVTKHLEDHQTGSYHYPTIIQTRDGLIHVVYSYFVEDGKSMKHAVFNKEWILAR